MIKDELEYQVSQDWVEKFKRSIAAMEVNFKKIEASKRIVEEWRERKMKKASQIS